MTCHSEVAHVMSVGIPLSILSASFFGSGHCAGMCGGLSAAMSPTKTSSALFHAGRICGYVLAGAAAGAIGETIIMPDSAMTGLTFGAALILSFLLIAMGIKIWNGSAPHLPGGQKLSRLFFTANRWIEARGFFASRFVAGFLMLLLPCGWLYGFIAGAAGTGSPIWGAAFMGLFGLGTLPALIATTYGFRAGMLNKIKAPRLAGGIFVGLGILTVALRVGSLL